MVILRICGFENITFFKSTKSLIQKFKIQNSNFIFFHLHSNQSNIYGVPWVGLNFYHHPGFQPMIICKTVYLLGTPCKCIILWSSPWGKPFLAFWEFVFTVGPRPVVLFRAVGTGCAITFRFQILERIKAKPFPWKCHGPPQIFRVSNGPNTSPSVRPWASSS